MPYLRIFRGAEPEGQVEVSGSAIRIGRDPGNDVVLQDPTKWVSRFHAEIRLSGSGYTIVDLGGPNRIRVNGQEAAEAPLSSGARIEIGPYQLEFVSDGPSTEPVPFTIVAPPNSPPAYPAGGAARATTPIRARTPQQPLNTQPQASVILPPAPGLGKTAKQAWTFLAIASVVTVVAVIDARRDPKPPAPPPAPPPIVLPPQDPAPTPTPTVVPDETQTATVTPPSRPTPAPQKDDPDIPRQGGEGDVSYQKRKAQIQDWWKDVESALAAQDLRRAINDLEMIDISQRGGYLTSDGRLNDLKRARQLMDQAAAEENKLEEAWNALDRAKALLGANFDGEIASQKAQIAKRLEDKANLLQAEANETYNSAFRSDPKKIRARTLYTQIRDLLPSDNPLRKEAEKRLDLLK